LCSNNDQTFSVLGCDENFDLVFEQTADVAREAGQEAAFRVRMLAQDHGRAGVDGILD
jgi:hypothetical protein